MSIEADPAGGCCSGCGAYICLCPGAHAHPVLKPRDAGKSSIVTVNGDTLASRQLAEMGYFLERGDCQNERPKCVHCGWRAEADGTQHHDDTCRLHGGDSIIYRDVPRSVGQLADFAAGLVPLSKAPVVERGVPIFPLAAYRWMRG